MNVANGNQSNFCVFKGYKYYRILKKCFFKILSMDVQIKFWAQLLVEFIERHKTTIVLKY